MRIFHSPAPHCTQGWKRRYCEIVGNQTLEYYAAQGGKAIGSFNLAGCEVAAEEDTKLTLGKEHCFSIRIGSVSRVFEAPTAKLCSKWIKALKRAAKASVLLQGPLEKKGQWRKVRGLFVTARLRHVFVDGPLPLDDPPPPQKWKQRWVILDALVLRWFEAQDGKLLGEVNCRAMNTKQRTPCHS